MRARKRHILVVSLGKLWCTPAGAVKLSSLLSISSHCMVGEFFFFT